MTMNVSTPQVQLALQLKSIAKALALGNITPAQSEAQKAEAYAKYGSPGGGGLSGTDKLQAELIAIDKAHALGLILPGKTPEEQAARVEELKDEKRREHARTVEAVAQLPPNQQAVHPVPPIGAGASFNPNNADYGQQARAEQKARLNQQQAAGEVTAPDPYHPRGGPVPVTPPATPTRHGALNKGLQSADLSGGQPNVRGAMAFAIPQLPNELAPFIDAIEAAIIEGVQAAASTIVESVLQKVLNQLSEAPVLPAAETQPAPPEHP